MRRALAAAVLGLLLLLALPAPAAQAGGVEDTPAIRLKVRIAGVRSLELVRTPDGRHLYRVRWRDGRTELLSPERFSEVVWDRYQGRPWLFALFNISSWGNVAWVALGLLGQVLFTGRMVVQWLVSEKHRRSVVPVAFWWMSLAGATMLLVYFLWRRDIVGVLGQSTGWFIYVRNLWLIYRRPGKAQAA